MCVGTSVGIGIAADSIWLKSPFCRALLLLQVTRLVAVFLLLP